MELASEVQETELYDIELPENERTIQGARGFSARFDEGGLKKYFFTFLHLNKFYKIEISRLFNFICYKCE